MASDSLHEVYRAHRDAQTRFTYFLLAASGAGIGFAVNQTQEATLGWLEIPLGIAVVFWGPSFFAGCRQLQFAASILYSNSEMLRIQAGLHPEVGARPSLMQAASDGVRDAIDSKNDQVARLSQWQFRLISWGGLMFVLWHLGQMYLRTLSL